MDSVKHQRSKDAADEEKAFTIYTNGKLVAYVDGVANGQQIGALSKDQGIEQIYNEQWKTLSQ